jgi:elongation factor Ts
MGTSVKLIAELRSKTSASFASCKEALEATNENMEEAVVYLRKKGLADIKGRAERNANEGTIGHYIHAGSKIGVLVEINSETDFVAKSADFQLFAKELAIHIAATNPQYISPEEVPTDTLEKEAEIALNGVDKNKPAQILEKIKQGRLQKYYQEVCLLEQQFVKDQNLTIKDMLGALASKVGEKIVIKRFVRFVVG